MEFTMNYKEAVKELDKLRRKDEVMFRMAINHLITGQKSRRSLHRSAFFHP